MGKIEHSCHLFATYKPRSGQTVFNLLSQGIIDQQGQPGPNFGKAVQNKATDTTTYSISPNVIGAYQTLPPPNTDGTPAKGRHQSPAICDQGRRRCG